MTPDETFLTDAEVERLVGSPRRARQIAWLAERGYPFEVNAAGRPVVLRYRDARDIAQERFRRSLSTADSAALGLSGMRASLIDADNAALMRFRADMAVILSDAEADALVRRRKA